MRTLGLLVPAVFCVACGQHLDHPGAAPACDPAVAHCLSSTPPAAGTAGGNEAGATSSGGDETATFTGTVVAFDDDYFDRGSAFKGTAEISATGQAGAVVTGSYDGSKGTTFQMTSVLQDPVNWFLVTPGLGAGVLPTLMPVDTSLATSTLLLGVANSADVDGIFLASSGTERALDRAQIALHLVDKSLRSVAGVTGTLSAEVTAYRAAGSWIGVTTQNITDAGGMIFFGNVPAGTTLSPVTVSLSGAVSGRVEVIIRSGALSVLTAIVSP